MKHEVYFDEKIKAAAVVAVGDVTPEEADEIIEGINKALEGKVIRNFYADISQSPLLKMSKEARKKLSDGGKTLNLNRIAITGVTPINRMMAKVILAVLGKIEDTKFFDKKEDAISWLNEEAA